MAGYIAGIGGANVDIHGQSDAPIVMRDSNPGRLHLSAGGVCRNICDNLCRLGLTVELCSAVGGDAYGDMLRGACTAAGIGTRHLAVFPAQNTSAYISIMDSEGDMLVAMSDMHILKEALTPSYVEGLLPVLNGADVCVADANLSAGALETLATRCTVPLMLDPVSTAWARNAAPLAGYFHTLKPNLMEMEVLSGMRITNERELDAACGMLLEKGVYQVFVSLGREGLYFRRQGCGALRKKSRPFPMKNATGAGDATMAGIVYAWVNGVVTLPQVAVGSTIGMQYTAPWGAVTTASVQFADKTVTALAFENPVTEGGVPAAGELNTLLTAHYAAYLDALNNQDTALISGCTEEYKAALAQGVVSDTHKANLYVMGTAECNPSAIKSTAADGTARVSCYVKLTYTYSDRESHEETPATAYRVYTFTWADGWKVSASADSTEEAYNAASVDALP